MDQSHVVVAGDDVPQSGEPLLHPLDLDRVRQRVPDVLQLLVSRVVGNQEPVAVTWRQQSGGVTLTRESSSRAEELPERTGVSLTDTQPADDATAGDGGVNHRDGFRQLPLEHAAGTQRRHTNTWLTESKRRTQEVRLNSQHPSKFSSAAIRSLQIYQNRSVSRVEPFNNF